MAKAPLCTSEELDLESGHGSEYQSPAQILAKVDPERESDSYSKNIPPGDNAGSSSDAAKSTAVFLTGAGRMESVNVATNQSVLKNSVTLDVDIEKGLNVLSGTRSGSQDGDDERICRVCLMTIRVGTTDQLVLGCSCKHDLALTHRSCAEEWFKVRGNLVCEICGVVAKNMSTTIVKVVDEPSDQHTTPSPLRVETSGRICSAHPIRRYLLSSVLLAFIIYWLLRSAYLT